MTEQNKAYHPFDQLTQNRDSIQDRRDFNGANRLESNESDVPDISPDPKLSLKAIHSSALLIDRELRIVWQNQAACTKIWHKSAGNGSKNGSNYSTIFDPVFDPGFQNKVDNWRQWVGFFLRHARGLADHQVLDRLVERRSERQLDVIKAMLTENGPFPDGQATSHMIQQVMQDGAVVNFSVVTTDFNEGRLFIFNSLHPSGPGKEQAGISAVEQSLKMIRQHPQPIKIPLFILAGRLNGADVLKAELLDDDYTELLSRLWQIWIETIERFGGIIGRYSSSGLSAYFSPVLNSDENPAQVIACALELRKQMADVGREWKIRKGWLHELELNIGIHGGEDHVGAIHSVLGESLLSYGNTLEVAGLLTQIAKRGQIVASKFVIGQLPQNELKKLKFGIFRQENQRQVFIANCFSRLNDLPWIAGCSLPIDPDLAGLPVTEVFDRDVQEEE